MQSVGSRISLGADVQGAGRVAFPALQTTLHAQSGSIHRVWVSSNGEVSLLVCAEGYGMSRIRLSRV
jgi:hypothetical protein